MKKQLNLSFRKLKKKKAYVGTLLGASFSEDARKKQKPGSLSLLCCINQYYDL